MGEDAENAKDAESEQLALAKGASSAPGGGTAEELLMQMVSKKGTEPGSGAGAPVKALEPAKARQPLAVMTIDSSDDEGGPTAKKARDASSSSSPSRRRSRSRKGRKGGGSSSESDEPKKKKRVNNFSSVRNVEKERHKMRQFRSQGAEAALAITSQGHLTAGPYFAP
mmetsp:Transcript_127474/g.271810  ORF Transcript_127474/g.271810 Transcript_127474/m.271810 type:complete len:168 (-) Transcript_127474:57-560(-)